MARKRLTNGEKIKILTATNGRLSNGESLRSIARSYNVTPFQLREWKRNQVKISATLTKKKSAGTGMTGMLKPFEAPLIGYALDQRALGVPVTYGLLAVKTCHLSVGDRQLPC